MKNCKHIYKIAYAPNSCKLTREHCKYQNREEECDDCIEEMKQCESKT